jgi:hypothetical protein
MKVIYPSSIWFLSEIYPAFSSEAGLDQGRTSAGSFGADPRIRSPSGGCFRRFSTSVIGRVLPAQGHILGSSGLLALSIVFRPRVSNACPTGAQGIIGPRKRSSRSRSATVAIHWTLLNVRHGVASAALGRASRRASVSMPAIASAVLCPTSPALTRSVYQTSWLSGRAPQLEIPFRMVRRCEPWAGFVPEGNANDLRFRGVCWSSRDVLSFRGLPGHANAARSLRRCTSYSNRSSIDCDQAIYLISICRLSDIYLSEKQERALGPGAFETLDSLHPQALRQLAHSVRARARAGLEGVGHR